VLGDSFLHLSFQCVQGRTWHTETAKGATFGFKRLSGLPEPWHMQFVGAILASLDQSMCCKLAASLPICMLVLPQAAHVEAAVRVTL